MHFTTGEVEEFLFDWDMETTGPKCPDIPVFLQAMWQSRRVFNRSHVLFIITETEEGNWMHGKACDAIIITRRDYHYRHYTAAWNIRFPIDYGRKFDYVSPIAEYASDSKTWDEQDFYNILPDLLHHIYSPARLNTRIVSRTMTVGAVDRPAVVILISLRRRTAPCPRGRGCSTTTAPWRRPVGTRISRPWRG